MDEIWRDVAGYEGLYQVSNLGRIKSFYNGERILKIRLSFWGYLRTTLTCEHKPKSFFVHRLVAEAFIPNPESKREVNHINGIKSDNRVENLEWHAFTAGLQTMPRGEDSCRAKLTNEQALYIRENPDGLTGRQLAEKFDVDPQTISNVQLGKKYKNVGGQVRKPKHSIVTEEMSAEIKRLHKKGVRGCGCTFLARKFGISESTVRRVINNREE